MNRAIRRQFFTGRIDCNKKCLQAIDNPQGCLQSNNYPQFLTEQLSHFMAGIL